MFLILDINFLTFCINHQEFSLIGRFHFISQCGMINPSFPNTFFMLIISIFFNILQFLSSGLITNTTLSDSRSNFLHFFLTIRNTIINTNNDIRPRFSLGFQAAIHLQGRSFIINYHFWIDLQFSDSDGTNVSVLGLHVSISQGERRLGSDELELFFEDFDFAGGL